MMRAHNYTCWTAWIQFFACKSMTTHGVSNAAKFERKWMLQRDSCLSGKCQTSPILGQYWGPNKGAKKHCLGHVE